MAVAGVLFLLVRYGKWQLAFAAGWEEEYHIKPVEEKPRIRRRTIVEESVEVDDEEEVPAKPVKRKPAARKTAAKSKE
jgi:hypothetical protein